MSKKEKKGLFLTIVKYCKLYAEKAKFIRLKIFYKEDHKFKTMKRMKYFNLQIDLAKTFKITRKTRACQTKLSKVLKIS